ncbi:hypothetical protein [Ensifer aridi]|uniref:hypothetical protein n=1 Tax=Ensifer aridi TaxID=1708715 RepID=UPI0015E2EB78|nr:hypothetical protein [Ensifer aridi]
MKSPLHKENSENKREKQNLTCRTYRNAAENTAAHKKETMNIPGLVGCKLSGNSSDQQVLPCSIPERFSARLNGFHAAAAIDDASELAPAGIEIDAVICRIELP